MALTQKLDLRPKLVSFKGDKTVKEREKKERRRGRGRGREEEERRRSSRRIQRYGTTNLVYGSLVLFG